MPLAGCAIDDRHEGATITLLEVGDFGAESDVRVRVASCVLEQHRLEGILRDECWPGGAERACFVTRRETERSTFELGATQVTADRADEIDRQLQLAYPRLEPP